uniref:Uncharacterized protein n=1 Tax=Oryza sativa subsp. japonica TaxID=39947 RepID=Q69MM6_ORYSJ|nr:hypothetical protein [Oryza sativa Japonica Group]BAD33884.1 hypothetical protein [Oryza sativa Japonica Group]
MASGKADVGVGGGEAMRSDGEAPRRPPASADERGGGGGGRGRGDQKSRTELGQSKARSSESGPAHRFNNSGRRLPVFFLGFNPTELPVPDQGSRCPSVHPSSAHAPQHLSVILSLGVLVLLFTRRHGRISHGPMGMLLSFLIPGISKPQQILLWQVAILSFLVGAGFIGLYLKFFYWSSERKIKKA